MMAGALVGDLAGALSLHLAHARRGLRLVRLGARFPDGCAAVPVSDHHQLFLCRTARRKVRTGVGADQRRAQPRRQHRRVGLADPAGAARAVPSVASGRELQPLVASPMPRRSSSPRRISLRHGTSAADAQRQAQAWLGQMLISQATFLAYIDVFAALSLFALLLVPAAFLLQRVDLSAARRRVAH